MPDATELLEKLYNLMCYSCKYTIFNSYDSFESIGIEQKEFFNKVLFLKYQIEPKNIFIKNALQLVLDNSLNRYTLYSDLIEMAIGQTNSLLQKEKEKKTSNSISEYSKYDKEQNINTLAEFGFFCYVKLFEMDKAIVFYKKNYVKSNEEIALYVLLKLLFSIDEKEYFMREYENAIQLGVKPRKELAKMYNFAKETGNLPEYFGWVP